MYQVPNSFKNKMKTYGKRLNVQIDFGSVVVDRKSVKKFERTYMGELFTSIMRLITLEIEKSDDLDYTLIDSARIKIGVKVADNEDFEYIDYGEFKVDKEKTEDKVETESYQFTLYDYLIDTHKKYRDDPLNLDYDSGEVTLCILLQAICDKFGFILKTFDFANSDKIIYEDKYATLDLQYRDILDEIAATAGGFIKIFNKDLYVSYPQETEEIVDEEDLDKLHIGDKVGEFNSLVLGRSPQEDNIFYPESMESDDRVSVRIDNNQIMDKNREDFIIDIYNKINGLMYYAFEANSFGFGYYEFGDIITLKDLDGNFYKTMIMNSILTIETGCNEKIYTDKTSYSETKYQYATSIEKRITNTEIICDKQGAEIKSIIEEVDGQNGKIAEQQISINAINNTVKLIGGNNKQRNSIGAYGTDDFEQSETGTIVATEEELLKSQTDNGFGRIIYASDNKWFKFKSESLVSGDTYTISFKYSNMANNHCVIKLINNLETTIVDTLEEKELENIEYTFIANNEFVELYIETGDYTLGITDYYLQTGDVANKWQPAQGEALSTVLSIYYNGIQVSSENSEIVTNISNLGFSVVNVNGKVLITFNKDKCILSDTDINRYIKSK